ncbi:MAG: tripartite tricarboxylate transporter permease, partial [Thermoplasmata archaeon]
MFIAAICAHNFSDILGSVLTGVPDGSELLTLQPAQRLMLKGEGHKLISAALYGSVAGILIGLALLLPVKLLLSEPVNLYESARKWIPLVLVSVAALIVLSEKSTFERIGKKFFVVDVGEGPSDCTALRSIRGKILQLENGRKGKIQVAKRIISFDAKKNLKLKQGEIATLQGIFVPELKENRSKPVLLALSIFLLSGFLGWTVLFTPLASSSSFTLLFPLFTGLFGVAGLIVNITSPAKLPEQKEIHDTKAGNGNGKVVGGAIAGMVIGIFPGITPGCGAVLLNTKGTKPEQYIALTSAIETSAFVFNIAALFIIQKTRSGAIATLEQFYGLSTAWNNVSDISPLLSLALFAVSLSTLCALLVLPKLGRLLLRKAKFFVRKEFQIGILIVIVISVFIVCGITGILVLCIATLIGLIPLLLNLRRIHLMGSILLPVTIVLMV